MTSGRSFVGVWATSTLYNDSDIVIKDGNVWVCNTGHTSTNFAADSDNWDLLAAGSVPVLRMSCHPCSAAVNAWS